MALKTSDIDNIGVEDKFIQNGIIWMNDESEALFRESMNND